MSIGKSIDDCDRPIQSTTGNPIDNRQSNRQPAIQSTTGNPIDNRQPNRQPAISIGNRQSQSTTANLQIGNRQSATAN